MDRYFCCTDVHDISIGHSSLRVEMHDPPAFCADKTYSLLINILQALTLWDEAAMPWLYTGDNKRCSQKRIKI